LVDVAVHHVGFTWIPGKGYSFPNGPYVEYSGDFSGLDLERAKERIEAVCRELIASDLPVTIEFMDRGEMIERLPFVPDYLPENRPARVVFMGDYGIPCGGTHVKSIKEVGSVAIRKMKLSGDTLRVSYQVE
jgi:Ser-tRNA(Ala) deacylase AlaX